MRKRDRFFGWALLVTMLIGFGLALFTIATTANASTGFQRHSSAKRAFARAHPCPANGEPVPSCPGFVIDHIVPLCAGGRDAADNMQWQDLESSLRKDVVERRECRAAKKPGVAKLEVIR